MLSLRSFSSVFMILLKGIGLFLFLWILWRIDRMQLIVSMHNASLPLVLVALGLFAPMYLLRSIRWHTLAIESGVNTGLLESTHLYIASLFLGIVTPGKAGEAMRIPSLMSKGLTAKKSIALTLLDRLLDIALLAPLGLLSIGILFGWKTFFAGSIGATVIVMLLFLCVHIMQRWVSLLTDVTHLLKKTWIPVVLLTICSWLLYYVQLLVLIRAFPAEIPLVFFLATMTVVGIISILPIAPAGLGTREAALLYFFHAYGIPPPLTIAFSFTIFLTTLVGSLIGAYCLWRLPHHSLYASSHE